MAILDADDAVGIFLCKLRVVGNHDNQTVLCNLFEQIHDLHTGFRVQCASGLICQQNIWIIHQRTGNSHALHLSAGHLVGPFVELIAQPHILKGLFCTLAALAAGNAGNRQCQFHICKNALMGNQVVALEDKTDGVVTVRIPVTVSIFLCGDTVDDQIAAVITVQTADDVEQRGLA